MAQSLKSLSFPFSTKHKLSNSLSHTHLPLSFYLTMSSVEIPLVKNTILLKEYPVGLPTRDDFEIHQEDLDQSEGRVILASLFTSVDPYLRILMSGQNLGYQAPFSRGKPIHSMAVARVLRVPEGFSTFKAGDDVNGALPWADYHSLDVDSAKSLHPVVSKQNPKANLSLFGITGLTAFHGLLDVGKLESFPQGSTVFVSGAAGATGNMVGQIAKLKGYRVIGSAGSDEKVAFLKEKLGFDAVFNYKTVSNLEETLKQLAPNGIDVYFDNVGGETFDAVLRVINRHGVIICCGAISGYNATEASRGVRVEPVCIFKEIRIEGFLVSSFVAEFQSRSLPALIQWLAEGKLIDCVTEFPQKGLEATIHGFIAMLKGDNFGKMVISSDFH